MAKSFEQRLAHLEKIITDFLTGTERSVTKTGRAVKRKAKATRKSIAKKIGGRKAAKRRRSA